MSGTVRDMTDQEKKIFFEKKIFEKIFDSCFFEFSELKLDVFVK